MSTQPGGFTDEVIRVLTIMPGPHDVEELRNALEDSSLPSVELHWDKTLERGLLRMEQLPFDIVLLDVSLPDGTNVECLQQIREIAPGVPVIVLTDVDDQTIALKCLQEGAQDFLIKGRPGGASIYRAMRYAIERKRIERIERESEDADRKLALSQQQQDFIAMLVHDLRTPIVGSQKILSAVVAGALGEVSDPVSEMISKVVHGNEAMLQMINNVLDSYRLESGLDSLDCREIEISPVIDCCLNELLPIALSRDVKLDSSIDTAVGRIRADRFALKRVIENLVGNAIKFTASGGTVKVSAFDRSGVFHLQISDTGIGIEPSEMENLFKRFWQGKKKYREAGLGLGLYLCKQLVEAQNGTISCTSEPGQGTTFEITLPYSQKRGRVLVVDDNALCQQTLQHFLESLSIESDAVSSGSEAVEAVQNESYSAVFMDLRMPDMDGYSTLKAMRSAGVTLPIVAYSAYGKKEVGDGYELAGFTHYLDKPTDLGKFRHELNRCLELVVQLEAR